MPAGWTGAGWQTERDYRVGGGAQHRRLRAIVTRRGPSRRKIYHLPGGGLGDVDLASSGAEQLSNSCEKLVWGEWLGDKGTHPNGPESSDVI
jgi:hypothetical protein